MGVGIDVIIPCYNSEKFIERCLDSIASNKYDNYNVILIDDYSTDNTVSVIENYINNKEINAVLLRNNENVGAGESRNIGIRRATKEFITFVDSDDVVRNDFFFVINNVLEKNSCDCLIYNAIAVHDKVQKEIDMFYGGRFDAGEISVQEALVFVKGCTVGKVYKKEVLDKHNVCFASLKRNEDLVFTKTALSVCKRVEYIENILYEYVDNPASLMHDTSLLDKNNAFKAYELIKKFVEKHGLEEELHSIYLIEVIYSTTMTTVKQSKNKKDYKEHFKRVTKGYKFSDKYLKHYNKKYRLVLAMFRMGLFGVVRKLVV